MRSLKYIFLALVTVFASQSAIADPIESLINDFERSKKLTLAYVEAMPEDRFDYQPVEGTRNFSEQMLHLSQGIYNLVSNATDAKKPFDYNLEKKKDLHNKEAVLKWVEQSFDFAISELTEFDEQLMDEIVTKGPFNVTRLRWATKAYEHMVHHRGQTVIYLRLCGVDVPAYELF